MRHMRDYVPDNPRAAVPTPEEMSVMFCDDWFSGSPCETCEHCIEVDRGMRRVNGTIHTDVELVCVEAHDSGVDGNFKLDASTVPETCSNWEMEG